MPNDDTTYCAICGHDERVANEQYCADCLEAFERLADAPKTCPRCRGAARYDTDILHGEFTFACGSSWDESGFHGGDRYIGTLHHTHECDKQVLCNEITQLKEQTAEQAHALMLGRLLYSLHTLDQRLVAADETTRGDLLDAQGKICSQYEETLAAHIAIIESAP